MLHVVAVDIEHWSIRRAAERVGLSSLSFVDMALFCLDLSISGMLDVAAHCKNLLLFWLALYFFIYLFGYIPCPGANQRSRHKDGRRVDC